MSSRRAVALMTNSVGLVQFGPIGIVGALCTILFGLAALTVWYTLLTMAWMLRIVLYEAPRGAVWLTRTARALYVSARTAR